VPGADGVEGEDHGVVGHCWSGELMLASSGTGKEKLR
jgi:hypothetical protein